MRASRKMAVYSGGVKEAFPFTYTGTYELVMESSVNWKIRFLTSGTFRPLENASVDVFAVGGGGSSYYLSGTGMGAGGGGGYTTTQSNVSLDSSKTYIVTIGDGGGSHGSPSDGYASRFEDSDIGGISITASGGKRAQKLTNTNWKGGNGGSGGGGNGSSSSAAGDGGSDGYDGGAGAGRQGRGQRTTGEGTTTREFGEPTGALYAGGGGGRSSVSAGYIGLGGAGGGGDGGQPGTPNTGGGAGANGGIGGSGIVIIRNARS